MIEIHNANGDTIRRSRNLRGIRDYARDVSPVERVHFNGPDDNGNSKVTFIFRDGSISVTKFASWRVGVDFVKARRSWRWGEWSRRGAPNSGPRVSGWLDAVNLYFSKPGAAA